MARALSRAASCMERGTLSNKLVDRCETVGAAKQGPGIERKDQLDLTIKFIGASCSRPLSRIVDADGVVRGDERGVQTVVQNLESHLEALVAELFEVGPHCEQRLVRIDPDRDRVELPGVALEFRRQSPNGLERLELCSQLGRK